MPKRLVLWLAAALVLVAATSPWWMLHGVVGLVDWQFPAVPQIRSADLAAWLGNPHRTPPLLLDVREPEEFAVGHLPGAVRADPAATADQLRPLLSVGRPVVVYCSVGYRSSRLAERLRRSGTTNVANLRGAIFRWANEGRALERDGRPGSRVHGYNRFSSLMLRPEYRAPFPGDPEADGASLGRIRPVVSIGLLVLLLLWESAAPFFPFFVGQAGRGAHGVRNVVLGLVNGGVSAVAFTGLWLITANWAAAHGIGLLNLLDPPGWLHTVGAVLLLDLWTYGWHRVNHTSQFLWRFHRVHHSDPKMDVTTANRFHLGEMLASGVLRIPMIALIGAQFREIALYEMLLFSVVQFHHANIWVGTRVDRWLRLLIVTPAMHKVHHSVWQPETDSNYASLLSIWDRMFGSFRLNPEPHTIRLGLKAFARPDQQSFMGLMKTPFGDGAEPPRQDRVQGATDRTRP